MVDLPLLAWLLRSVHPATRLIFVGDKDQLASIRPRLRPARSHRLRAYPGDVADGDQAPGRRLADHRGRARHQSRRASGGALDDRRRPVRPAREAIDRGRRCPRAATTVESAVRLGAQVLTPQHTSSVGVSALNRALQARLNPAQPSRPEVQLANDVVFRLGDKLIVGKNNYQTLCFNGETGSIVDIGASCHTAVWTTSTTSGW